jgi:hypothetical protein
MFIEATLPVLQKKFSIIIQAKEILTDYKLML